jgi:hypothetical protein
MSEDKTYNGWTNYETWAVKLWLDNDQGTNEDMNRLGRQAIDAYKLSKQIQEFVEEGNPLPNAGLYTDLLNGALSEVNWYEIAEAYIEDNADEDVDKA